MSSKLPPASLKVVQKRQTSLGESGMSLSSAEPRSRENPKILTRFGFPTVFRRRSADCYRKSESADCYASTEPSWPLTLECSLEFGIRPTHGRDNALSQPFGAMNSSILNLPYLPGRRLPDRSHARHGRNDLTSAFKLNVFTNALINSSESNVPEDLRPNTRTIFSVASPSLDSYGIVSLLPTSTNNPTIHPVSTTHRD